MGADGGYRLYKVSEVSRPETLRRIQNWFLKDELEQDPVTGVWQKKVYGPWDNHAQNHSSVELITVDEWLKRNGFSRAEDMTLEFMVGRQRPWASIIKAGELPGLSEDLLRVSYGDNVPDEFASLSEVIEDGVTWGSSGWKKKKPSYFPDVDAGYPEDHVALWSFSEETWT